MHNLTLEHLGRNSVFSKRLFLGIYLLVPQTKDVLYKNIRTPISSWFCLQVTSSSATRFYFQHFESKKSSIIIRVK